MTEDRLPSGQARTASIEGPIRIIPGRAPHAGANRSAFDHHGHLIADQFGGPGDADAGNVVPMHGHQNSGAGGEYKRMEAEIRSLLGDRQGWMRVDVGYLHVQDVRPHLFEVQVRYSNGMHSRWRIFNYGSYMQR